MTIFSLFALSGLQLVINYLHEEKSTIKPLLSQNAYIQSASPNSNSRIIDTIGVKISEKMIHITILRCLQCAIKPTIINDI